ncbi:hypothetical protein IMX12_13330 [Streptomyces sp. Babs14]|uniref:hypothetical protein n=1 Tax=unclassified Streptomyces TaxID=2593676 RepID=UPI001C2461BE|nr:MULTISPECIES: hypothetical protein [unclassified Streptomyces]MBU8549791.1 hypothetical protein [Streptomyces sp. Osf17]MBU8556574.1 hypothetical protein [Streptomyces sp. Babs14]
MGSRIPEVIARLVALGKADALLADVHVSDGPEVTETSVPDWLIVGFDGDQTGDFEAAQSSSDWTDLGTGREEEFQVTVAAVAKRGDTDTVAARARVYEIGDRVEAWTRADPSLGLDSLQAGIGATRLVQDQDNGAQAVLLMTVAGRAFT